MRLLPAPLPGLVVIEPQPIRDVRGSFSRVWDKAAFRAAGLTGRLDQCNVSRNARAGTLRGMHWQVSPHAETKLVRCIRGRVYDVAIDVRPGPTRFRWFGIELDAESGRGLYIPEGFAHGFLTLEDDCDVEYLMTGDYQPNSTRGLRYDDATVGVAWPGEVHVVSDRDLGFPAATNEP